MCVRQRKLGNIEKTGHLGGTDLSLVVFREITKEGTQLSIKFLKLPPTSLSESYSSQSLLCLHAITSRNHTDGITSTGKALFCILVNDLGIITHGTCVSWLSVSV